MTSTATATRSPYTAIREAFINQRRLTIDSGQHLRRDVERRHALRSLVTNPTAVLERHRHDVRSGADVLTTATWGVASASCISTEPDRWMAVARRGIRLARLAIAAQRRVGEVAVAFSLDAGVDLPDGGLTMNRLARVLVAERPDLLFVEARSASQPTLQATFKSLDTTRLPLWLSLPRVPKAIDWLEQSGRRTRVVDVGTAARPIEITRW
jgi:homocysteine S-methyltransferase